MSTVNIHDLLTSLAAASDDQKAFREAVLEWTGSPDSKKKGRKAKKATDGETKAKRTPTAWNAWIESCCGKKGSETSEYLAWKEEQKEAGAKPSMMAYAKSRKEEDLEAYEKFAAGFKSSATSAASATTHDSEDEAVAEIAAKPAKKAPAKGKKAAGASSASESEAAVVIEAKPAKKAAAKPKKAAKKAVVSDSESE